MAHIGVVRRKAKQETGVGVAAPPSIGPSGIDPTASEESQAQALDAVLVAAMYRILMASGQITTGMSRVQRLWAREMRMTAREIRATLKLLAELKGKLATGAQVSVLLGPCHSCALILGVLDRWPDLRLEIAQEIERVAIAAGEPDA